MTQRSILYVYIIEHILQIYHLGSDYWLVERQQFAFIVMMVPQLHACRVI